MYISTCWLPRQIENGRPGKLLLNPCTVCSWCKWKFVVCFVDRETNGSYLFANGLNGLAHLYRRGSETGSGQNVNRLCKMAESRTAITIAGSRIV